MHKNTAVKIHNVSKVYKLYDKPIDRLKESLHPLKKKYHKEFYALKDINLEIKKGEVLGIVGVNGAGKSTLLKIITGVLTPSSGYVNVNGQLNAILELGAGLKPEMTGSENIKLHLQINGIEKNIENITQEIIEFADIGEHINQPIKTYSSGMKARLGFGIATSTKPDVLIVDEALSVGDTVFKLKSYEKMKSLMQCDCTVLYVSHNLQSVVQLCTRAILLMNHTIVDDGTPKDIIEEYQHRIFSKQKVWEEQTISKHIRQPKYKKGYFSHELVKKPKVLKNYNVDIGNINIYDADGEIVNILEINKNYIVQFNVEFGENIQNAMFGVQFKTINGLFVYGIREESKGAQKIRNGEIYTIRYRFNNTFLPNTYYLNIASASNINGTIEYLTEYSECNLFKVIDDYEYKNESISEYGIVRLDGQMELEKN